MEIAKGRERERGRERGGERGRVGERESVLGEIGVPHPDHAAGRERGTK